MAGVGDLVLDELRQPFGDALDERLHHADPAGPALVAQSLSSNARRAAPIARSTSSAAASGTTQATSPVDGFTESNVFPSAAPVSSPSMSMRNSRGLSVMVALYADRARVATPGCDTGSVRPVFRVLRAVAALGGAAVLLVPAFTAPVHAADETVSVGEGNENKFAPATVRIRPGDTVTWQYAGGSGHTVTSTTSNWSKNDPVGPPAILTLSTSYLFDKAGTYRYVCTEHRSVGMKGTVIVEGAPRPLVVADEDLVPAPHRHPYLGAASAAPVVVVRYAVTVGRQRHAGAAQRQRRAVGDHDVAGCRSRASRRARRRRRSSGRAG